MTAADVRARWDAEAMALPPATRQAFLDLIWESKTIGEARKAVGISFEAAMGIMGRNIVDAKILNREAE